MHNKNLYFYCSKEPIPQSIREKVYLVGFDIDWHFNRYIEYMTNYKGKDCGTFSEFLERQFKLDGAFKE